MLLKDRLSDSCSNSKRTVGDLSSIIINPNLEICVMLLEDRLSDSSSNSKTTIGKRLLEARLLCRFCDVVGRQSVKEQNSKINNISEE